MGSDKEMKPTVCAIMYDFDKTLSPRDMQEYAFIKGLGMNADEFWSLCNKTAADNGMDSILAYMYVMLSAARGKMLLNREEFVKLGASVKLYDGVKTWFSRVNKYAEKIGVQAEHYIISSGLKEIIEGTPIAKEFKDIFAASFCYDDHGVPVWPAMAVNYTSKTQFLFRINKDVLDIHNNADVNEYVPDEKRRVPFRNMIYIGDGYTDVPCMKLVKSNGGHSVAVYSEDNGVAAKLLSQGRVDFTAPADYTKGSRMEKIIFFVLDKVRAEDITVNMHMENLAVLP